MAVIQNLDPGIGIISQSSDLDLPGIIMNADSFVPHQQIKFENVVAVFISIRIDSLYRYVKIFIKQNEFICILPNLLIEDFVIPKHRLGVTQQIGNGIKHGCAVMVQPLDIIGATRQRNSRPADNSFPDIGKHGIKAPLKIDDHRDSIQRA